MDNSVAKGSDNSQRGGSDKELAVLDIPDEVQGSKVPMSEFEAADSLLEFSRQTHCPQRPRPVTAENDTFLLQTFSSTVMREREAYDKIKMDLRSKIRGLEASNSKLASEIDRARASKRVEKAPKAAEEHEKEVLELQNRINWLEVEERHGRQRASELEEMDNVLGGQIDAKEEEIFMDEKKIFEVIHHERVETRLKSKQASLDESTRAYVAKTVEILKGNKEMDEKIRVLREEWTEVLHEKCPVVELEKGLSSFEETVERKLLGVAAKIFECRRKLGIVKELIKEQKGRQM